MPSFVHTGNSIVFELRQTLIRQSKQAPDSYISHLGYTFHATPPFLSLSFSVCLSCLLFAAPLICAFHQKISHGSALRGTVCACVLIYTYIYIYIQLGEMTI